MRILKLFVISLVVLFLLLTAFASLLPSQVRISRAIDISDGADSIKPALEDLTRWKQWNEYIKSLPGEVSKTSGIRSNELSITLTDTTSGLIKTTWVQRNGKTFPAVFRVINNGAVTTVQWYFEYSVKWYPWEKFGSIVYDKQLGPDMEKSLKNLKQLIEKEQ